MKSFKVKIITTEIEGEHEGEATHVWHEFQIKAESQEGAAQEITKHGTYVHYQGPRGTHYYIILNQIIEIQIKEEEQ